MTGAWRKRPGGRRRWDSQQNRGFGSFSVLSWPPFRYSPSLLEGLKSLPEDPDDLKGPVAPTGGKIKSLTLQTEDLQGQLAAHPKARFGPDSERLDPLAVDLQEDTGIAQAAQVPHGETSPGGDAVPSETPAKRPHSRALLPDRLARPAGVPSPGDACASGGGALRPPGEDVMQEREYISFRPSERRHRKDTPERDNTLCERSIRPLTPDRKNCLFMGSEGQGKAVAIACTRIETARMTSMNPEARLPEPIADHKLNRMRQACTLEPDAETGVKRCGTGRKRLIRKAAGRTYDKFWKAVGQVCDLFKEEECCNFLKAAG